MLIETLHILLGAALVAIGVLASALSDRIRGLRAASRDTASRERASSRPQAAPAAVIPVVETAAPAAKPRAPRAESKPSADGADDVVAALVAAGYKKLIASEATWACGAGERASIEGWTAAALRRCARGGMS